MAKELGIVGNDHASHIWKAEQNKKFEFFGFCFGKSHIFFLGGVTISGFSEGLKVAAGLIVSFDPELWQIILLSLRVTLTALILASLVGIPLGIGLGLKNFPGKPIVSNLVSTFMGLPPVVVGLTVYILLSNSSGLTGEYRLLFTPIAMIIAQFLLALPLMIGLTSTSVTQVDKLVTLTAKSLGASGMRTALTVTREARFSIYSNFIVVFGRLIAEVGAVMMVGGNIRYSTRVMTTAISMHRGMGEYEMAIALGIILLLMAFIINGCLEILRNLGRAA